MHRGFEESQLVELAGLRLPLPSARVHLDPADPARGLLETILNDEGLKLEQFRLQGFREMFFSKGDRAGLCPPSGLKHEPGPDEFHPGKEKLTLAFDLPRGSYATVIVKRITIPGSPALQGEEPNPNPD